MLTCSVTARMSSTLLFEAASSSSRLKELPRSMARQDSQCHPASPSGVGERQLMVRANILAHDVLPTPRGPQKRYAWARRPDAMAPLRVEVRFCWPTTLRKVAGLYFRALTIYWSLIC